MISICLNSMTGQEVLAGASKGKSVLGEMIVRLPQADQPQVVVLDFSGIGVATGSFLREAVVAFRDYCRSRHPNLYPVIANANAEVLEELTLVLKDTGQALVACSWKDGDGVRDARVVGVLDEKQRVALDAVTQTGSAEASQLQKKYSRKEKISVTGWNNRLAALSSKGILMEFRHGRSKVYRPVVEGMVHGT